MSIFRLFELLVFIAQKGIFSFQNIVKIIFLTNIAEKKMLEKWPYWDQNQGLTPFEKCKYFDFWNFLFLLPRKAFFNLEYRKSHFPNLQCRKKMLEKWPYFHQNHGLTLLKKCQFFEFLNFLFLLPIKALFRYRVS